MGNRAKQARIAELDAELREVTGRTHLQSTARGAVLAPGATRHRLGISAKFMSAACGSHR